MKVKQYVIVLVMTGVVGFLAGRIGGGIAAENKLRGNDTLIAREIRAGRIMVSAMYIIDERGNTVAKLSSDVEGPFLAFYDKNKSPSFVMGQHENLPFLTMKNADGCRLKLICLGNIGLPKIVLMNERNDVIWGTPP